MKVRAFRVKLRKKGGHKEIEAFRIKFKWFSSNVSQKDRNVKIHSNVKIIHDSCRVM